MSVFVLDKQKKPLMPCSEKRARLLLTRGRAVVVRMYPFTIRLKDRIGAELQPLRLGIDPGSKITGLALVRESETVEGEIKRIRHVLWLAELTHRGHSIREALSARRAFRRRCGRASPDSSSLANRSRRRCAAKCARRSASSVAA